MTEHFRHLKYKPYEKVYKAVDNQVRPRLEKINAAIRKRQQKENDRGVNSESEIDQSEESEENEPSMILNSGENEVGPTTNEQSTLSPQRVVEPAQESFLLNDPVPKFVDACNSPIALSELYDG